MKKYKALNQFLMILIFVSFLTNLNAQTGLNFQGVARTASNTVIASQDITLKLSILQGSATGLTEYVEVRKVTTNAGVKGTMTLNMGVTLVNWEATTSNSVSCLVLFESTKSGLYTPPRFYDPTKTTSNFVGNISVTDKRMPGHARSVPKACAGLQFNTATKHTERGM